MNIRRRRHHAGDARLVSAPPVCRAMADQRRRPARSSCAPRCRCALAAQRRWPASVVVRSSVPPRPGCSTPPSCAGRRARRPPIEAVAKQAPSARQLVRHQLPVPMEEVPPVHIDKLPALLRARMYTMRTCTNAEVQRHKHTNKHMHTNGPDIGGTATECSGAAGPPIRDAEGPLAAPAASPPTPPRLGETTWAPPTKPTWAHHQTNEGDIGTINDDFSTHATAKPTRAYRRKCTLGTSAPSLAPPAPTTR